MWIGTRAADPALLAGTRARIERALGCATGLVPAPARPDGTWDARRRQHASGAFLAWLAALDPRPAARVLAVTDEDLFIPVLTFVFGEAQLGGPAAVVSTARLDGRPDLLAARLAKEAVHELGHTWGLLHCDVDGCVMGRSAGLREVDAKTDQLCRDCRSRLRDARGAGGRP